MRSEREKFESWAKAQGYHVAKSNGNYVSLVCNDAWEAWQAAKADAVPEGFVVVPKEPTEEMIDAGVEETSVDWKRLSFGYKTMIEVGEIK